MLEYEWDGESPYRFFIPHKYSEKKAINTPCYSKTHPPVLDLLSSEDEELATIFQMKLQLTSSIEMSRAKRFESIAKLGVGFGMPYSVSGAHTHRLGGCVTADTKVLTMSKDGKAQFKPIVKVELTDLVWDGEEFCTHDGVVNQGEQWVVTYDGITGTNNHKVFIDETATKLLEEVMTSQEPIMYAPSPEDFGYTLQYLPTISMDTPPVREGVTTVYDLVDVGRKNRFWANGKLIHNSGGLNVQNLSSGRKAGQSNALKRSITAFDGHVCVAADSSQVECRVLPYIANDQPYLQVFLDGKDPYSVLASQIYGGDPDEIKRLAKAGVEPYSNIQRPAGKAGILGCLTRDCEVLCQRGWVKLLEVTLDDLVWNGDAFVPHTGVVFQGVKDVTSFGMTLDHLVFNGFIWEQSQYVEFKQAMEWAVRNLPNSK